jgi:hypothetical protein
MEADMVNKNNTLTVAHLLKSVADGRVKPDMPIGVIRYGTTDVVGIVAFELHTYPDGTQVFVAHCETPNRPVAHTPGETAAEVGLG